MGSTHAMLNIKAFKLLLVSTLVHTYNRSVAIPLFVCVRFSVSFIPFCWTIYETKLNQKKVAPMKLLTNKLSTNIQRNCEAKTKDKKFQSTL